MQETKKIRKKASIPQNDCVACGSCIKVCPLGAISIYKGVYAQVDEAKCVGCGKCAVACPASIISVKSMSQWFYRKTMKSFFKFEKKIDKREREYRL